MSALSAGAQPTLESVYDEHAARCFGLAVRLLNDERQAAAVVHAAFIDLWHGRVGADTDLGCWLALQTHRLAVERLRQDPHAGNARDGHASRPADDHVLTSGLGTEACLLLDSLPAPERLGLVLAYWGGFTEQEIAVITGVSVGAVRERCRAGLLRLREVALSEP